ncbi:Intracellular distribution of mitochondria [Malassezia cuniculi]|uniref:Clustered mitochondria protein homolog n=1 Tax=Malassezia cuniculi TaxID=948313 RepID=A0AAF0EU90_9BASI|nr:Intracellular distribution of mitochondria [Malassezia cuniculi]
MADDVPADTEPQVFDILLHLPRRPLLPKESVSLGLPETPSPLRVAVTPHETLSDLRATINDSPEGYWLGAFAFFKHGSSERVNEWIELCDVFSGVPADKRELTVEHVAYNAAEARAHVQRLRDLLSGSASDPSAPGIDGGLTVHDAVAHPAEWAHEASGAKGEPAPAPLPFHDWREWKPVGTDALLPRVAASPRVLPRCLRNLALSAWNPPPQHLALKGHLLYIRVDILEGETLEVAATTAGFYVCRNSVHRFDPAPADRPLSSPSLFDLLAAASGQFLSQFARLFNDPVATRDFLSAPPVTNALPAYPWQARQPRHESDMLRTQAAYLLTGTVSADSVQGSRDWNDELQAARELPRATLAERLMRDRVLQRLMAEFTLAATRAVPRVAAGEVPPMNPVDAPSAHMYLFNNLFVSKGVDGMGIYGPIGGDAAAHVAVGKDVIGVRLLGRSDAPGLALLGTVVVDWLGERWVVQSVLPDLFRADGNETQVVYGSTEGPDSVRSDEKFHELLEHVAKSLHLDEHVLSDSTGKEHKLWLSADCKGIQGSDGRRYILDVARLLPTDVEWLERDMESYPHRLVFLRPELLTNYYNHELREYARTKLADAEDKTQVDASDFKLSFNPDAFAEYCVAGNDTPVVPVSDESQPSVKAVRDAARFLRETAIPRLVSDVAAGLVSANDGIALSQLLHERGINLRYLGYVADLSQPSRVDSLDETVRSKLGPGYEALLHAFRRVAIHDMIARATKHVLRRLLRGRPQPEAAACVSHVLNCLVGGARNAAPKPEVADAPWSAMTPESLAEEISAVVSTRFRFELPELYLKTEVRSPQLLRLVALRTGIQLRLQAYEFDEAPEVEENKPAPVSRRGKKGAAPRPPRVVSRRETTFVPEDVLCIVPRVKSAIPKSSLAEEAVDVGRLAIARGDRELGTELLIEGVGFHEQVYGVVHPDVVACYALFAMLAHQTAVEHTRQVNIFRARAKAEGREDDAKEDAPLPEELQLPPIVAEHMTFENALRFQRQAVTAAERTLGLDHPDTMVQYMNLAAIQYSAGDSAGTLRTYARVLDLWQLLYGPDHPDAVHTLSAIALTLQSRREFAVSLRIYETAYDLALRLFGPDSIHTGNMAHEYAQALTLSGDLKQAIAIEKEARRVFQDRLGEEDALTKESHAFLSSLASSATRVAQMEKAGLLTQKPEQRAPEPRPVRQSQPSQAASLGSYSVDELVQYIQGGAAPGKAKSKAKSKKNGRK